MRRHQADGAGRHQVRLQRQRRRERRAAAARSRTSTPSSSAPAPRSRATCRSRAGAQGRPLRDGLPHRQHQGLLDGGAATRRSRQGQGRRRHRRRRHRHRLRRHRDAPRLQEPRADRDPAQAARWSAPDNPWPEWPKVYKMDYGQEEAAAKFGADPRVYLTTVKKFVGDEGAGVKALVTVEIKWEKNDKGQFVPVEQPGTEKTLPAQLVLLAMGFLGPEQPLLKELGLEPMPAATSRPSTRSTRPAQGRLRRRRLPPRPEPRRLGHQRRPRRRPRVRPLPDGLAATCSCSCAHCFAVA
jgi:hypothetical protein